MLDENIKKFLKTIGKKGGKSTANRHPGMAKEWGRAGGTAKGSRGKRRRRKQLV